MARTLYVYNKALGRLVKVKKAPVQRSVSCWPVCSDTCAVRPEQVPEAQRRLAEQGVQTDYQIVVNAKGDRVSARPILRDRAHKRDHFRAVGIGDPDATSHLDATPLHWHG